ncbi:hypothetical protein MMC17_006229 [Xylographa soralifera]|nr:hypothetical protein [Xylographa soralifera]
MAFQTPLPNALTFATVPESVWHCCTCATANNLFEHPVYCSVCLNPKCGECIDDIVFTKPWQPAELSQETVRYTAFPPRSNEDRDAGDAGEVGNGSTASPPQPSSPKRPRLPEVSEKNLEQLAEATSEAVRIDVDRVTRDNPDVNILQGYRAKTNPNLKPEEYYQYLEDFYKLPHFPRSTGLYEGRKLHFGFNPEHLDTTGALYKENALPNNLNNPIHAIFNINHWTNMEDSIYKVLEPALRLASMYLQQPVAFQHGAPISSRREVNSRFEEFSKFEKYNRAKVHLHADYYIAARKFRDTTHLDNNHLLRFYFLFATTLVHEISHCLGIIDAHHGKKDSLLLPEPFLGTANVRENGLNWERATFGGAVQAINWERSGRYGAAITDWSVVKQYPWQISWYAIRMEYIERIQQQEHWNAIAGLLGDEDRSRYLYVPRHECAVAGWVPAVMPMRFEDLEQERLWNLEEEREAEEDRLEELEYEENDKIQDELDRKEEERKAKEKQLILAEEAKALLEKEINRYAKEKQRQEDEARARYRERFGDDDPWTFENLIKQQEKSKRPSMRVPAQKRVPDRRNQSPEDQQAIPDIDNPTTREIQRLRREQERRKDREVQDRSWRDREMERRAMEVRRERERAFQREGRLFPPERDTGGSS